MWALRMYVDHKATMKDTKVYYSYLSADVRWDVMTDEPLQLTFIILID